jgi:hypothetical protein
MKDKSAYLLIISIDFSSLLVCTPRQRNASRLANDREDGGVAFTTTILQPSLAALTVFVLNDSHLRRRNH